MNNSYPVYTVQNECHDCYKCIRHCHVKAIKIKNGHASVMSEKCIACGKCTIICPQNAKKVRGDISRIKTQISIGKKVYVSLAPTWSGVFDVPSQNIISALKSLGFAGVSETALGAQEVSIAVSKMLSGKKSGIYISSACPAAVDYIRIYRPEFSECITKIASPALTHSRMLRQKLGKDVLVVFIGPCVAKKNESDNHPDELFASLTFDELNAWLRDENVDIRNIENQKGSNFIPESAYEGALYPIEGGMNDTLKKCNISGDIQLLSVSSIPAIKEALGNFDVKSVKKPIFLEALACEGGCVNGPCNSTEKSGISIVSDVLSRVKTRKSVPKEPALVFEENYLPADIADEDFEIKDILDAMSSIGKHSLEDELNCGGCGYDTCRQLAKALLLKEAEPSMCTSYMRKVATKKAVAMLRFMPSGIVMVGSDLRIVETNEAFLKMFASDMYEAFDHNIERASGAALDKILPCSEIFKAALRSGKEVHRERYPINGGLYDITVFTIEKNQIVGAVITDVTKTEMRRDQIAKKAQAVISKNITIVQDIACMLGEHMVDTELLLNSIAEGYETSSEVIE